MPPKEQKREGMPSIHYKVIACDTICSEYRIMFQKQNKTFKNVIQDLVGLHKDLRSLRGVSALALDEPLTLGGSESGSVLHGDSLSQKQEVPLTLDMSE